ncbi:MAG: hypothetical protein AAF531_11470 [Actinomycetota bacterium]
MTHPGDAPYGGSNPALIIYRPLVEKLLAALGALVTHQIAYLLAGAVAGGNVAVTDHGHLSVQWAVVTPVAVAAAALFIIWQLRSLGFRSNLSARSMGAMVGGFFVVQELIEGFVSGRSAVATMTHPAILIGIAIAPIVAWFIARLLSGVTELAARFVTGRPSLTFPLSGPRLVPVPVSVRSQVVGGRSRPRAPPSRLRS